METKPANLVASGKYCPICEGRTITTKDEEYILCLGCGMIRTKYNYDSSQYSTNYALNYLEYAKSPCNTQLNLSRLGLISRWLPPHAAILDIGCCVGEFIRFAEKYYRCEGFEPNSVAAKEATKRVSSLIYSSSLNGVRDFDCVTMFDVIEHLQEPLGMLKHIHAMLVPGGIVALTTPNAGAIGNTDKQIREWKHYKPKEHLYLHTAVSLSVLMSNSGFKMVHFGYEESDIRPGNPNGDLITYVARKK